MVPSGAAAAAHLHNCAYPPPGLIDIIDGAVSLEYSGNEPFPLETTNRDDDENQPPKACASNSSGITEDAHEALENYREWRDAGFETDEADYLQLPGASNMLHIFSSDLEQVVRGLLQLNKDTASANASNIAAERIEELESSVQDTHESFQLEATQDLNPDRLTLPLQRAGVTEETMPSVSPQIPGLDPETHALLLATLSATLPQQRQSMESDDHERLGKAIALFLTAVDRFPDNQPAKH
ncbi:hypothetical protein K488DRAFT_75188, partial [Vararia minispora EC-137]